MYVWFEEHTKFITSKHYIKYSAQKNYYELCQTNIQYSTYMHILIPYDPFHKFSTNSVMTCISVQWCVGPPCTCSKERRQQATPLQGAGHMDEPVRAQASKHRNERWQWAGQSRHTGRGGCLTMRGLARKWGRWEGASEGSTEYAHQQWCDLGASLSEHQWLPSTNQSLPRWIYSSCLQPGWSKYSIQHRAFLPRYMYQQLWIHTESHNILLLNLLGGQKFCQAQLLYLCMTDKKKSRGNLSPTHLLFKTS